MHPIEETTIRSFIAPHRRPRWLTMLEQGKIQQLARLDHCADIDLRFAHFLPSNVDAVALLTSHGAPPDCFIISSSQDLHGRFEKLAKAIEAVQDSSCGSIISCIHGQLAYYYDEDGSRRALLLRPASERVPRS